MDKLKCPEIRFGGFKGNWVSKNLEEEVKFFSGLTYSPFDISNKSGTLVLRSSNVQDGEISTLDNVYVRSDVVYCQNVEIGDIIVVVRNGSRNLIGKHATVKFDMNKTVIGAFMTGIRAKNHTFINALFDSNNFAAQVNKNLGATINQITNGAFKSMSFDFPQEEEQTAIGNFFQQLDQSIVLQQQKYTQTQNLKKAMLEKMFPKAGSKQPEIRLKGFGGDWEEFKLGQIYGFNYGEFNTNPSNGGQYQVYGANGIIGGYTSYNAESSAVIGHMGEYAGSVLWAEGKHFVTYNGTIAKPKKSDFNSLFGYFALVKMNLKKVCGGSGQPFLSYDALERLDVLFPTEKEQTAIGQFFKQLDDTLALQQQQLQTLKNLKQAFLGKMFV